MDLRTSWRGISACNGRCCTRCFVTGMIAKKTTYRMFFWHGSGAPYQGQMNHFNKFAKEKLPCEYQLSLGILAQQD